MRCAVFSRFKISVRSMPGMKRVMPGMTRINCLKLKLIPCHRGRICSTSRFICHRKQGFNYYTSQNFRVLQRKKSHLSVYVDYFTVTYIKYAYYSMRRRILEVPLWNEWTRKERKKSRNWGTYEQARQTIGRVECTFSVQWILINGFSIDTRRASCHTRN